MLRSHKDFENSSAFAGHTRRSDEHWNITQQKEIGQS